MKTRRYIALLLLAVYLVTAGGPAYLSLSCRCAVMRGLRTEAVRGGCGCVHACGCCAGHRCGAESSAALSAPCCSGDHSTEIDLYTAATSEEGKSVRCAVVSLPPSLAAECPCPAHVPALRGAPVERPAPLPAAPLLTAAGLRAPPALV